MSDQTPPPQGSVTIGGLLMILLGALLLLFPGGCGLFGLVALAIEKSSGRTSGSLNLDELVLFASLLGLAVAVLGFFLIRWGLRLRSPAGPA